MREPLSPRRITKALPNTANTEMPIKYGKSLPSILRAGSERFCSQTIIAS